MRVSWLTGLPSALIETHVVCSARISTVKVGAGGGAAIFGTGVVPGAGFAEDLGTGVVAEVLVEGDGVVAGDLATAGFTADGVAAIFGEAEEASVVVAPGVCAEIGDAGEVDAVAEADSRRR